MAHYSRKKGVLQHYPTRIFLSLIGALLLVITCIRLWPPPGPRDYSDIRFDTKGQETIAMEEILPTKQAQKKPPPPPPLPPVVVPDDVVLDEADLDLQDETLAVEDTGTDTTHEQGNPVPTTGISARADSGPKPVRIVEPEYTREAQRKKVRAEVVLQVLVDDRGRVMEVRVTERYLLNKDKTRKTAVARVGYGVEESAIAAARQWHFRPARKSGQRVTSYTTLSFSFGV